MTELIGAKPPLGPVELSWTWWWRLLGWQYLVYAGAPAIIGLICLIVHLAAPQSLAFLSDSFSDVRPFHWWLLFAVLFGGSAISAAVTMLIMAWIFLWYEVYKDEPAGLVETRRSWIFHPPRVAGFIESILYPTSWLAGVPEFIAAWLALKVAGQWRGWQEPPRARHRYQMFMVGNAMSIMLSMATVGVIKLLAM